MTAIEEIAKLKDALKLSQLASDFIHGEWFAEALVKVGRIERTLVKELATRDAEIAQLRSELDRLTLLCSQFQSDAKQAEQRVQELESELKEATAELRESNLARVKPGAFPNIQYGK